MGFGLGMKLVINGRFLTQRVTGVQRYARELVVALDDLLDSGELAADWQVTLVAPKTGEVQLPALKHIELRRTGWLSGHAWEQLELPRQVDDGVLFCPGNTAPLASLYGSTKTVVTVHDLSYLYFPDAYSASFRAAYNAIVPAVLRHADAVITVSQSERRAISERYPFATDRLVAIANGGLPRRVNLPEGKQRRFALYVGAFSKRKNVPGILGAAIRLNKERHLPFVFVGEGGPSFQSVQMEIPAELRDRIEFAGQVDDLERIVGYMSEALCLVFPSFYEASPLPPMEAMACGTPVISSPIDSMKERCGDAALYCDPASEEAIAEAIGRLVDDADLQEELRRKSIERARRFTWEACARQTMSVIERVASQ